MNDRADFAQAEDSRQQRELHQERWELSMEALEWAQEHGMSERLLKHLAYECNVRFNQIGKGKKREMV